MPAGTPYEDAIHPDLVASVANPIKGDDAKTLPDSEDGGKTE